MPNVEEMRRDPRAADEGLQKARALPREHLAELCREQKRESEQASADLRRAWQAWWELWQNQVTYPDKEEWQSQIWIGTPFAAVEQAASLIKRSLLESPEFFGVGGTDDQDKLLAAHVVRPLCKVLLDQSKFVPKYADATKLGFIMGVAGYLKFRWNVAQTPALAGLGAVDPDTGAILPSFVNHPRSMLAIDYVLPWRIFRDPDSLPRENFSGTYLWHSEWKDRTALRAMAGRGWDTAAVERLLAGNDKASGQSGSATGSQQEEAQRKQQQWVRHKFRKSYLVDEGWLDVLDLNGDVVLPNALLVHAHDEILYGPADNPIWATDLQTGRRKWPFIAATPIVHPGRFEGRGILEQDEPLSLMLANTLNLFADGMNWEVNPDTEVYQQGLVDWDDTRRYPGRLWLKTIKEQVLMQSRSGKLDIGGILAFLNYLDQKRQNANFVNEFVIGLPGSRTDITKGEVQLKTGQSLGIFDGMGKDLELGGRDAVALCWDFALQYLGGNDYTDPGVVGILGPQKAYLLAQMPLEERVRALQGNFDFTFTGVTQALQKADLLQKVMQFATLAGTPPYAGRTNPGQVLRTVSELLGINDRIDIFDPPPPVPGPALPGGLPGAPGGQMPQPAAMMRAVGAEAPAAAAAPTGA